MVNYFFVTEHVCGVKVSFVFPFSVLDDLNNY
jgi:hypothetical protein